LAQPGQQYAAYLIGADRGAITLDVPRGSYQVRWFDPRTAAELVTMVVDHPGGAWHLELPRGSVECALAIRRKN
jgi:hypothetical protein